MQNGRYVREFVILIMLVICLGFSHGIRPALDFGTGWSYFKPEIGKSFCGLGIGVTAPFSRYVGLNAGLSCLISPDIQQVSFLGDLCISSRISVVEKIAAKYASPYFSQGIVVLVCMSSDGRPYEGLGIDFGLGVEFLSNCRVNPVLNSNFSLYVSTDESGDVAFPNMFSYGFGIGVRIGFGPSQPEEIN